MSNFHSSYYSRTDPRYYQWTAQSPSVPLIEYIDSGGDKHSSSSTLRNSHCDLRHNQGFTRSCIATDKIQSDLYNDQHLLHNLNNISSSDAQSRELHNITSYNDSHNLLRGDIKSFNYGDNMISSTDAYIMRSYNKWCYRISKDSPKAQITTLDKLPYDCNYRPLRSGIIPYYYSYLHNKYYYLLAIDKIYGDYTDFGGQREDQENFFQTAYREMSEESSSILSHIFPYAENSTFDLKSTIVLKIPCMCVIMPRIQFQHLPILSNFVANNEVSAISWVSSSDFESLILGRSFNNHHLYNILAKFLRSINFIP